MSLLESLRVSERVKGQPTHGTGSLVAHMEHEKAPPGPPTPALRQHDVNVSTKHGLCGTV